jgi:FG-GAP-like repeat
MQISLSWDSSVLAMSSALRASFEAAVTYAADYFASLLDVPYSVTIDVGWGEITQAGQSTPITQSGEALGGVDNGFTYSYSQVEAALKTHVNSAATASAYAALPTSDPTGGGGVYLSIEEAEALGLPVYGQGSQASGSVGFAVGSNYNFSTTNRAVSGEADFVGIAEHEIAHALGRMSSDGVYGYWTALDLFRFTSAGTLATSPYQTAYFSANNGATALKYFDSSNSDPADWAANGANASNDSFNAYYTYGVEESVSLADVSVMNLLGYRVAPVTNDFNDDRMSDVLFRNAQGVAYLWEMNNTTVTNGAPISTQVGNNWQISGTGDFNGDGSADLLWTYKNSSNASDPLNGVSYITFQNGPTATNASGVVQQLSSDWQLQGVGDFNGDGISDVVYRSSSSGQTYIDIMNGTQVTSASGFTSQQVTDPSWQIAAVADFVSGSNADILWRYDNTSNAADPLNGDLYLWQMNGTNVVNQAALGNPGANWQIAGTGDFNGDGAADILFRYNNPSNAADPLNGVTYIDFMNGSSVTSGAPTQWQVDNSWVIAGIGDYNGDGTSDILWQQSSTGNSYIWDMNGTQVASAGFTSEQAGTGWTAQNGKLIG